jgi:hypothetical protein
MSLATLFQEHFWKTIENLENSSALKEATINESLSVWTKELTTVVIKTCNNLNWQASAIGYRLHMLPIPRNEYLSIDVMAFLDEGKRWHFPKAALELENSLEDNKIAYSLWKVMCVKAELKIVFCYRRKPDEGPTLIDYLTNEVVNSMDIEERERLDGHTLVVIGSRNESENFPFGFFKWWELENNTGNFRRI